MIVLFEILITSVLTLLMSPSCTEEIPPEKKNNRLVFLKTETSEQKQFEFYGQRFKS